MDGDIPNGGVDKPYHLRDVLELSISQWNSSTPTASTLNVISPPALRLPGLQAYREGIQIQQRKSHQAHQGAWGESLKR